VVPPVLADDDRRAELNARGADLDEHLDEAHSELEHMSAELLQASDALAQAEVRLGVAQQELATTRGELAAARSLDEQVQAELEQAEQELADAEAAVVQTDSRMTRLREDMSDLLVSSYQYGNAGMAALDVILGGGDPSELSENLALADSVIGAQAQTLDELTAEEVLLEVEQERVEVLRDEVAIKREAAAENLAHQRELTAQAVEQAAEVRAVVAARAKAEERAARARQAELDRIAELEADRERVKKLLQALAAREQPGPTVAAPAATEPTDDSSSSSSSSSSRSSGGYLSWPLNGASITSPYGMRMHPILHVYKLHDGTDFGAACGTPLYAASDGQVVEAYYDGAYGNRVLMANGTVGGVSLSTSYNHLTSDTVQVGQSVSRGQLIGYVGTTGYSTGCHLHFMVYRNGVTTDPMNWLS
jgi:murein DD-endopeptidase MepM/ murein hydrolase activator NlpD